MDTNNLQEILLSRDSRLVRPAWKPRWSDKPSGRPKATKFGGSKPYCGSGYEWPRCGVTNQKLDFLFQLDASSMPQKACELSTFKSGLLQVFHPCEHVECEHSRIIPENEIDSHIEEYEEDEDGTEVATWNEIGNEVPLPQELYVTMAEEGLIEKKPMIEFGLSHIYEMSSAWVKWHKMCFGDGEGGIKPKEMLVKEFREKTGQVNFPQELGSRRVGEDGKLGEAYPDIKLGGWIHWFHELDLQLENGCEWMTYPMCPVCKVKMTSPLITYTGSDKIPHSYVGFEGDGTTAMTLCPNCQRVGIEDGIQDLYHVEVNMIL